MEQGGSACVISRSPPSFSINSCRLPEAKPRGGRLGLRSPELARTARFQKRSRPVRPGMSRGTHPDIRILTTRQRTHDDAWHISSTVLIARDLLSLTHSSLSPPSLHHTLLVCSSSKAWSSALTHASILGRPRHHPSPCSPPMLQSVCSDAIQEHFIHTAFHRHSSTGEPHGRPHAIQSPHGRQASRRATHNSHTTSRQASRHATRSHQEPHDNVAQ